MKKFLGLALLFIASITLSGCYNTETTTFTLEDVQSQISSVYEELSPVTVAIVSYDTKAYDLSVGHGSGLIYDREDLEGSYRYYVITNYHVIEGQSYLRVLASKYYDAKVYALNEPEDLALLTFETTEDLQYFGTEQFDGEVFARPTIGSFVITIGTPLDLDYFNTATLGVVGLTSNPKVIQHDASINPGNSGGPLFDLNGNLLGFNTWKRSTVVTPEGEISVEGIGFAISMLTAVPIVNKMRHEKEVVFEQPKLGVTVSNISDIIEKNYAGVRPEHIEESIKGVYVVSLAPLRPSEGLVFERDIITHVNDQPIESIDELRLLISEIEFGDKLNLTIRRYSLGVFSTIVVELTL